MLKYERYLVYPLLIGFFLTIIFLVFSSSSIKYSSSAYSSYAIKSPDRAQKDKWADLDYEIMPIAGPGEEIEADPPYSIVDGSIDDEFIVKIYYTVMINKNNAVNAGREGIRRLLLDLFSKTSDWVDENYSKEKWREIYIFVKIPGFYGCIAILNKPSYPIISPPTVEFPLWEKIIFSP